MYLNYLEHPKYGRLWYWITLRNVACLGYTKKQNLEAGPCCEIVLWHYHEASWGKSPQEAIERMTRQLDIYADHDKELMPRRKNGKPWLHSQSWLQRWKLKRLFRKFERDGMTNPVTEPFDLD